MDINEERAEFEAISEAADLGDGVAGEAARGINWRVRLRNPVFWVEAAAAVVLPLIVGVGYEWEDMTSWAVLGQTLLRALGNPVVVVSMVASVFAVVNDPTTAGLADSERAMGYDEPKEG